MTTDKQEEPLPHNLQVNVLYHNQNTPCKNNEKHQNEQKKWDSSGQKKWHKRSTTTTTSPHENDHAGDTKKARTTQKHESTATCKTSQAEKHERDDCWC